MGADRGESLPKIDRALEEQCKNLCRFIQVLRKGECPDNILWTTYQEVEQRFSKPLICNTPETILYITAQRHSATPRHYLDAPPVWFRDRFAVRVADSEKEVDAWDKVRRRINADVRPRLWPVAALWLADIMDSHAEEEGLKIERIARLLGLRKSNVHASFRMIRNSLGAGAYNLA